DREHPEHAQPPRRPAADRPRRCRTAGRCARSRGRRGGDEGRRRPRARHQRRRPRPALRRPHRRVHQRHARPDADLGGLPAHRRDHRPDHAGSRGAGQRRGDQLGVDAAVGPGQDHRRRPRDAPCPGVQRL
ncbi:MAG: PaaD-like protein (DUF59) involved in Fe-S cluster assembly, partial [uncultured Nocardioidaceae bacterium]